MSWLLWPLSDDFLLPANTSFNDFVDTETDYYVKKTDILLMPIWGAFFLLLRSLFERYVATRLGLKLGIQTKEKKFKENDILESCYKLNKVPNEFILKSLVKKVDWSERKIKSWFRKRRNFDRPSLMKKFQETFWRLFFYLATFTYGIITLSKTPWFWDTQNCWSGFPFQPIWKTTYYYYMFEGGFYISLLFSLGKDNKRKDFVEQIIHHLATIFLITFSYACNFVRVGTLVMMVHDISDIFLEAAKCAHYAQFRRVADNLFTIFAVVFIVSRLIVFPKLVLYTTLVKSLAITDPYPGYYFFNFLLFILQFLHLFWTLTILRMAYGMLILGVVQNDHRSDVEEITSEDED